MSQDRFLFARVSCMLAIGASLMGSTAPSPLYGIYIERFALSDMMAMAVFALYAVGILSSLMLTPLLARHIRDQRFVLVPGLVLTAAGLMTVGCAENVALLFIGRILNGAGAGMVTGIASVRLYELAPEHRRARAATVSTLSFSVGAAIGPMLTSVALAVDLAPTLTPFLVITLLCLIAFLGVFFSSWPDRILPVGSPVTPDLPGAELIAQPGTPLRFFGLACVGLGLGWFFASVLMGLGPHAGVQLFGMTSVGLAGMLPAIFQLASGAGQIVLGRLGTVRALLVGVLGMAGFQAVLMLGMSGAEGVVMLVVMPLLGFFYGATFVGALGLANEAAPPARRTEYIARFYIFGHIAGVTPTMGMGVLVDFVGLARAFQVFTVCMVILAIATCLYALLLGRARRSSNQVTARG